MFIAEGVLYRATDPYEAPTDQYRYSYLRGIMGAANPEVTKVMQCILGLTQ